MAQKRKRRDLTLADKYEAVKLLEQKLSQAEVAKRMGCSQPQVHKLSNEVTELKLTLKHVYKIKIEMHEKKRKRKHK